MISIWLVFRFIAIAAIILFIITVLIVSCYQAQYNPITRYKPLDIFVNITFIIAVLGLIGVLLSYVPIFMRVVIVF